MPEIMTGNNYAIRTYVLYGYDKNPQRDWDYSDGRGDGSYHIQIDIKLTEGVLVHWLG